jgi:DNA-directed RNA polymerase subunit RPC12/RpoP
MVIIGIFLPWAAITAGKIGPFSQDDTPTGWDMAYSQKNIGSSVNIAGAIFIGVFMMLIFAAIGTFIMLAGRDGASFSYFLISTSVFFLIFMLFLLPYIQQSIPNPGDASQTNESIPDNLNNTRNMVQDWKDLKMNPLGGFYLSFAGAIIAYVGSRLIVADTARIINYRKYSALLAQAHADGKVTTDEEALLAKEREILKISREEQIYLIRKTVADPALQERLIQMHDRPVDIEKILRDREFQTYKKSLIRAWSQGTPGQDASDIIMIQREGLAISEKDHDTILNELIESGQIVVAGSMTGITTQAYPPSPKEEPGAGSLFPPPPPDEEPSEVVRPSSAVVQPSSAVARPSPAPMGPPPVPKLYSPPQPSHSVRPASGPSAALLSTPERSSGQMPAPQKVSLLSAENPATPAWDQHTPSSIPAPEPISPPQVPAPERSSPEPMKRVKCSKCGELIPINTEERPIQLVCPKCGFTGMLKK